MELLEWRDALNLRLSATAAEGRKAVFDDGNLLLPENLICASIFGAATSRSPGAGSIQIEACLLTAERPQYQALGCVLLAYALSKQQKPFRLKLTAPTSGIAEIVLWPTQQSGVEIKSGLSSRIGRIFYKPRLFEGNPNYTTDEQMDPDYPREHLPYCRLGAPDVEGGGIVRQGESVCLHFRGTGPSLVWLGKFLLNMSLHDSNVRLAYLYNIPPVESMAVSSAELRLTVANTGKPELLPPPDAE